MIFHNRQAQLSRKCLPTLKINGVSIERVKEFRFLGIVLNENLTWSNHIDYISIKISKIIGIMSCLKNYLPKSCLKFIYLALIHSHLNYGILVWGYECKKIFKLQKKAVRILSKVHYLDHTDPLYKKENILKVDDIFKIQSYKFSTSL